MAGRAITRQTPVVVLALIAHLLAMLVITATLAWAFIYILSFQPKNRL